MPFPFDCPHCNRPLSISRKLRGSSVTCPLCQGKFQVPAAARATSAPRAAAPRTQAAGAAPMDRVGETGPRAVSTQTEAAEAKRVDFAEFADKQPTADRPKRDRSAERGAQVAKFIAATPDRPSVQLAADGKLPELKLLEGAEKPDPEAKSTSANPLVLVCVLLMSTSLSVFLLFTDFQSGEHGSDKKQQARREIRDKYFGGTVNAQAPYQVYLREAQQAHSRGDRQTEREKYQQVLELLRAEHGTGLADLSPGRRKELEGLISALLSDN